MEQKAQEKQLLDLQHLKHDFCRLSAPSSSLCSAETKGFDKLPFQEVAPCQVGRILTCIQIIAVGSLTQPLQSCGGKKAITGKHGGGRGKGRGQGIGKERGKERGRGQGREGTGKGGENRSRSPWLSLPVGPRRRWRRAALRRRRAGILPAGSSRCHRTCR